MYEGVIDRIEDDWLAVIMVEDIGEEYVIDKKELPNGAEEGSWLRLKINESEIVYMELNEELTKNRKKKMKSLREKLKNKSKESKFKRK